VRMSLVLLVTATAGSSCSLWNRIDTCDEPATAPITVNRRFDGSQLVPSPFAIAPLPTGNGFVVFSSEVGGLSAEQATEIRSGRVTASGATLPSCERNDGLDDVLVPVNLADPARQVRDSAVAVSPPGGERPGLVVYRAKEGDRPRELWGLFIDPSGCPFVPESLRRKPFLIAAAPEGGDIAGPGAILLSPGSPNADFLVTWSEITPQNDLIKGRARVLRHFAGADFLPVAGGPRGEAVDLPPLVHSIYGVATARLSDGRTALAVHHSTGTFDSNVQIWIVSDRLEIVSGPLPVSLGQPRGEVLLGRSIVMAFDGQSLLVAWAEADHTTGQPRVFARVLDAAGQPRGPAFRAGSGAVVTDNYLSTTAWPGNGFLLAWREEGGATAGAGPRIMARAIRSDGQFAFSGASCSARDFAIAGAAEGERRQVALATLPSSDLLAIWTDETRKGADSSGTSLQGKLLLAKSFFPEGLPPPRALPPGMVGPVPDAGADGPPDGPSPLMPMCNPTPGSARGGEACRCDTDCEPGASCVSERVAGVPGGACLKRCDATMPTACGPGGFCLTDGTNLMSGFCLRACTKASDCPAGRVCFDGACNYHCSADSDCLSGHCDPYRSLCSDGTPRTGGGLSAKCLRREDCRSGFCTSDSRRCLTTCQASRPACPEGGICALVDGDLGTCYPPCVNGNCVDPTLICRLTPAGVRYCR
jgi:hypothetical protein